MNDRQSHIKTVAIFMGARIGRDQVFEARVNKAIVELGTYLARRRVEILYGAGINQHGGTLKSVVESEHGSIRDVTPADYRQMVSQFSAATGINNGESLVQPSHLDEMLFFKRHLLKSAQAEFVLPGAYGMFAEIAADLEESDVKIRNKMNLPLTPTIVLNIPDEYGAGYLDDTIRQLKKFHRMGRAHSNRQAMIKFVPDALQAIMLFEAYERLGPMTAAQIGEFVPEIGGIKINDMIPDLSAMVKEHRSVRSVLSCSIS